MRLSHTLGERLRCSTGRACRGPSPGERSRPALLDIMPPVVSLDIDAVAVGVGHLNAHEAPVVPQLRLHNARCPEAVARGANGSLVRQRRVARGVADVALDAARPSISAAGALRSGPLLRLLGARRAQRRTAVDGRSASHLDKGLEQRDVVGGDRHPRTLMRGIRLLSVKQCRSDGHDDILGRPITPTDERCTTSSVVPTRGGMGQEGSVRSASRSKAQSPARSS